jgi:hypothetical protein
MSTTMMEMEIFAHGITVNFSMGCQTSRLPYFLDNQLTDGGEVVSFIRQPPFALGKIPGTHFC